MATHDLRPEPQELKVMKGDRWSARATVKDAAGAPVDLTDYAITSAFKPSSGDTSTLDISHTTESLEAGQFWYGQDDAQSNGSWSVMLAEAGGLPRTYFRGTVVATKGADDA